MGKEITELMIKTSYDLAKKVYLEEIELSNALSKITEKSGMHRGFALAYVSAFRCLMSGSVYSRMMKATATRYYLYKIYEDFGLEFFKEALKAVNLHIEHYRKTYNKDLRSIIKVVDEIKLKHS
ncbi:hypothetical protein [Paenibacillus polymyxa]|uniref:hypothetical protein n=1 Tax=Paenibacillus polymyxa TaxID=1406 RepID=UPI00287F5724|nr:hypothetical protein [Paenibacillus polymyxa]